MNLTSACVATNVRLTKPLPPVIVRDDVAHHAMVDVGDIGLVRTVIMKPDGWPEPLAIVDFPRGRVFVSGDQVEPVGG